MSNLTKVFAVAACLLVAPHASPENSPLDRPIRAGTPSAIPARIKEFLPDFYLITGRGGNSVVRNTSEGPILIDSKVMYNVVWDELSTMIKQRVSEKPIQLGFITHHHADHGGNSLRVIESGADLVGHKNIVDILADYKSIIAPVNPAAPTVTFDNDIHFTIGDTRVSAYYWGSAHTDADIVVYFPDDKVVVVGDIVDWSGEPDIDTTDGRGSIIGMRQRLDDILGLDFSIAVAGHGESAITRAQFELYRDRFDALVKRGLNAVEAGVDAQDLHKAMQSFDLGFRQVGHFWTEEKHITNIHRQLSEELARRNGPAGAQ